MFPIRLADHTLLLQRRRSAEARGRSWTMYGCWPKHHHRLLRTLDDFIAVQQQSIRPGTASRATVVLAAGMKLHWLAPLAWCSCILCFLSSCCLTYGTLASAAGVMVSVLARVRVTFVGCSFLVFHYSIFFNPRTIEICSRN